MNRMKDLNQILSMVYHCDDVIIRIHIVATKIQSAFRNYQARLRLTNEAAWKIHEKLDYSSEQTEAKLRNIFEKLLKASDILSSSVKKSLQKPGLPLDNALL
ncbi:unnamed protein product [Rotaria sp. Silwood1]|nr:unnamed protein product [Rotaria sp. Silwood1]